MNTERWKSNKKFSIKQLLFQYLIETFFQITSMLCLTPFCQKLNILCSSDIFLAYGTNT